MCIRDRTLPMLRELYRRERSRVPVQMKLGEPVTAGAVMVDGLGAVSYTHLTPPRWIFRPPSGRATRW